MIATSASAPEPYDPSAEQVVARSSAPAKVMLFGEYAVLEGHQALAMCLNRRITCEVVSLPRASSLLIEATSVFGQVIEVPIESLSQATPTSKDLALLWPVLRRHRPVQGGFRLRFLADFPTTWGLGSSSASTLAAVSALHRAGGHEPSPLDLFTEARDAQRALQGQASGYDVATQLLGGYVQFQDGAPPHLTRMEPPSVTLDWIVAWSGQKASTGAMIRTIRDRFPVGHGIYGAMGDVSREGIRGLERGDLVALGEAMNSGHALLDELGAVPEEHGAVVRALQADPDVLGARLTGAGGGDCILILAADRRYATQCAEAHGLEVLDVIFERDGLVEESLS
ncbi:MAG TPA: hypothetical protein DIU15_03725 [Deltaproteobacteria bacterium]|nr:hypothetical protein [Deltaproteobacteria bacterium]HCP45123.1 hypothetical protein [Deltaproteobacteria bacterium]